MLDLTLLYLLGYFIKAVILLEIAAIHSMPMAACFFSFVHDTILYS
jgi:hypothetical protein